MKTQPIQYADFVLCLFLRRLRYNTFHIVMAISFTVNKQNIKYDKLIANTLHLMPLGIRKTQICTDIVPMDQHKI